MVRIGDITITVGVGAAAIAPDAGPVDKASAMNPETVLTERPKREMRIRPRVTEILGDTGL
ncbi:hypothetical protein GCM10029978_001510 [Actinoallomurus acanthiterrae]